jgi:hypothetical protein
MELKFKAKLVRNTKKQKKGEWFFWKITDKFDPSFVDLNTVCVFTGHNDKNKKEIYSGDIVTNGEENPIRFGKQIYLIAFTNGGFFIGCLEFIPFSFSDQKTTKLEVVGNLHDSSEHAKYFKHFKKLKLYK